MTSERLAALAEPNRLRIVELLRIQPRSVGEIADRLVLRQPQVSKHLKVLSVAGWVSARPRSHQHVYELNADSFRDLDRWLENFRTLWEARYQRLDALLEELQQEGDQG